MDSLNPSLRRSLSGRIWDASGAENQFFFNNCHPNHQILGVIYGSPPQLPEQAAT